MSGVEFVLGVDAGGTKVKVEALGLDGERIALAVGGPANVLLGMTQAIEAVAGAVTECLKTVHDIHPEAVCLFLGVGMAGAQTEGVPEKLRIAFTERLKLPCQVVTDGELAFEAAHRGGDGILVIAGTGSIVYGRKSGRMFRRGGWGHLLGDEGAGYAIAVAGIKAALRTHDDGLPETELGRRLREAWGVPVIRGVVDRVYQVGKAETASLCKAVEEAANAGDGEAAEVLHAAGLQLAELVGALIRRMELEKPVVACTGSILEKARLVREPFEAQLKKEIDEIRILPGPVEPVLGALTLQRKWKEDPS